MDKAIFLNNNAEIVDNKEKVMVFMTSTSHDEVVQRVRNVLNWMHPS